MIIGKYTFFGLALDIFDWMSLGMVPILGDIIDVFAAVFWYKKAGAVGVTALVELVPFADVLPTNIVIGYLADRKEAEK